MSNEPMTSDEDAEAVHEGDPLARFFFVLLMRELPAGTIERTLEQVRAVQREVPSGPVGQVAMGYAARLRALVD